MTFADFVVTLDIYRFSDVLNFALKTYLPVQRVKYRQHDNTFKLMKGCEPFLVFNNKSNRVEIKLDNPKEAKMSVVTD